jgi:hypothetical protein
MTVFIAHAPEDRAAAESLEKAIERRGQFVELDDGNTALRPVQGGDALVLLVSTKLVFAPTRLRLERRALDAWAEGRLVLVKLDRGIAPVGLRDLPMVDATFEAQRDPFTWMKVADQVTALARPRQQAPAPLEEAQAPQAPPGAPPVTRGRVGPSEPARKRGGAGWLWALLLAVPGLGALGVAGSIWLANRIGPVPGGWAELVSGVDAFGARIGAPAGITPWLFGAAIALLLVAPFVALRPRAKGALRAERAPTAEPAPTEEAMGTGGAPTDAVFVSYARANQQLVLPVIEAAQEAGRKFWVDQQGGIGAGENWAGEIVRAIRGAGGVVVMCSRAAFESDHVKREIYLADRYRKRLLPVFIEPAEPPEDFEYFFAGVQHLNLFETPEAERPQAFIRVLG